MHHCSNNKTYMEFDAALAPYIKYDENGINSIVQYQFDKKEKLLIWYDFSETLKITVYSPPLTMFVKSGGSDFITDCFSNMLHFTQVDNGNSFLKEKKVLRIKEIILLAIKIMEIL